MSSPLFIFVDHLGNLKIQLSCCWKRSMTSWAWPLNSHNSNKSFLNEEFLFNMTVIKWESEGQLITQRLHYTLPECLTVWVLPDSPCPLLLLQQRLFSCSLVILVQIYQVNFEVVMAPRSHINTHWVGLGLFSDPCSDFCFCFFELLVVTFTSHFHLPIVVDISCL